jgi:hypothetical protein
VSVITLRTGKRLQEPVRQPEPEQILTDAANSDQQLDKEQNLSEIDPE